MTLEVEITRAGIVPSEPEGLPEAGRGLLAILQPVTLSPAAAKPARQRVELPLIRGDGKPVRVGTFSCRRPCVETCSRE